MKAMLINRCNPEVLINGRPPPAPVGSSAQQLLNIRGFTECPTAADPHVSKARTYLEIQGDSRCPTTTARMEAVLTYRCISGVSISAQTAADRMPTVLNNRWTS